MYAWLIARLPEKISNDSSNLGTAWAMVSVIGGSLLGLFEKWFKYLGGPSREDKLFQRYYNELLDMLDTNLNNAGENGKGIS